MGPLDLTKSPPRSARAELDGIAYLPRAIDKIRAEFPGGSLGEYVVMGTTGATVTGNFYRATGIKHDELVEAVKGAPDDDAVGVWLRSRLDDDTIAKWNERYYHSTIGDIKGPLRERMFLAHAGAEALPEATPLADMFDADDVAMFGIRFQLFSIDFDEGGTLPHEAGSQRIWAPRRKPIAPPCLGGCTGGNKEFCHHNVRPGRADRLRLLALGGGRSSGKRT